MTRTTFNWFWRFLREHTMLVLALLSALGATIIYLHMAHLTSHLIEYKTVQDAKLYSEAIAEFRTLYTSEVVETVRKQGILVVHDYREHPGSIPLPATLSMLLGKRIGETQSGAETLLYSAYPFPWRTDGGLKDDFAHEAWTYLQDHPDKEFHRVEQRNGIPVLRFASADRMRPSCVNCHNTHPDSPKKDWKEGDVRGVLEVILPIVRVEAETRAGLRGTMLLMGSLTVVGLGVLALVIGRLRRTTLELEQKLGELRDQERKIRTINEDLSAACDEALAASRAKSQFQANMSHELRTPLNAILGYSEMLAEELQERGLENLVKDLHRIHGAGENLRNIVTDIMDLTKLDTEAPVMSADSIEVAKLVEDLRMTHASLAEKSGNAMTVRCAPDVGTIRTDEAKLRRGLGCVLANAFKFTEHGSVTLEVSRVAANGRDDVLFRISDTGIGMSPELMARLFEPFMQADESSTRRYGGAGLGLALAKRYCVPLGGEITVASEPGKGSTFTIRVPVHPAPTKA